MASNRTRPARNARKSHDPDFVYEEGSIEQVGCDSIPNKKAIRKKKKQTIKKCPEILFADCGDGGFQKLSDVDTMQTNVFDVQFYTNRQKEWVKHCRLELMRQYTNGQIPQAPALSEEGGGHRISVSESTDGEDPAPCRLSIFHYDNGTVMVQGAEFLQWCKIDFPRIKSNIDNDEPEHVASSSPGPRKNSVVEKQGKETSLVIDLAPIHDRDRAKVSDNTDFVVNLSPVLDRASVDKQTTRGKDPGLVVDLPPAHDCETVQDTELVVTLPPTQDNGCVVKQTCELVVPPPASKERSTPQFTELVVILPPIHDKGGVEKQTCELVVPPPAVMVRSDAKAAHTDEPLAASDNTRPLIKQLSTVKRLKGMLHNLYTSFPNLSRSRRLSDHSFSDEISLDSFVVPECSPGPLPDSDPVVEVLIDSRCKSPSRGHPSPVVSSTPENKATDNVRARECPTNEQSSSPVPSEKDTSDSNSDSVSMSARLKLVTWANKALEQKNKDLKQQITTTNATIEGLQKGRNEQKTRISQLLAKVASLEIDIANREIEVDTLRKVQQESKTLMNIVKKCKKDASNVASRVDSLSKERGVLKSQAEQLHARTQELELKTTLLRSQLDAAHVKLGSLERMRSLGQANIMLTGEGSTGSQSQIKHPDGGANQEEPVMWRNEPPLVVNLPPVHEGPTVGQSQPEPLEGGATPEDPEITQSQPDTEPQTGQEKRKLNIRLVGDSTVRGMGPYMQSSKIDSIVITKPGAGINRITNTVQERWQEDILAIQCGFNDIGKQGLVQIITNYSDMIDSAVENHPDRPIIVTELPSPGGLFKYELRKQIRDLNCYLANKSAKHKNVYFLPLDLKLSQMEGVHVGPGGQKQMASKILNLASSLDIAQNFTKPREFTIT